MMMKAVIVALYAASAGAFQPLRVTDSLHRLRAAADDTTVDSKPKVEVANVEVLGEDAKWATVEPKAAVEAPAAVVEEPKAAVEEPKAVVEEPKAAVEETKAVVEEPKAAVEETKAVVEETKAAVEETKAAVEETKAAVEETKAVVEETKAVVEEPKAAPKAAVVEPPVVVKPPPVVAVKEEKPPVVAAAPTPAPVAPPAPAPAPAAVKAAPKAAPAAPERTEKKSGAYEVTYREGALTFKKYANLDYCIARPSLPRPLILDGSHAGDRGFDPMGFATDNAKLYALQEAEVRHCRLAMLCAAGWPLSELFPLADGALLAEGGRAPSVLNGNLLTSPVSLVFTLAVFAWWGEREVQTLQRSKKASLYGHIHAQDLAEIEEEWPWGVAGDESFDPLGLYGLVGKDAVGRFVMRDLEISHGRVAMLAVASYVFLELATGIPVVKLTPFLF